MVAQIISEFLSAGDTPPADRAAVCTWKQPRISAAQVSIAVDDLTRSHRNETESHTGFLFESVTNCLFLSLSVQCSCAVV